MLLSRIRSASLVGAGLLATAPSRLSAQASQTAPKSSENEECRGNGCAASPDAPVAESDAGPSPKPYDWKASFKEYKVGKVPRLADGHPDLPGVRLPPRTGAVPLPGRGSASGLPAALFEPADPRLADRVLRGHGLGPHPAAAVPPAHHS